MTLQIIICLLLVILVQLGDLVLRNTNVDDWVLKECHHCRGCLVNLV
jgi:hypothetical protein